MNNINWIVITITTTTTTTTQHKHTRQHQWACARTLSCCATNPRTHPPSPLGALRAPPPFYGPSPPHCPPNPLGNGAQGMWMALWVSEHTPEQRREVMDEVLGLFKSGVFPVDVGESVSQRARHGCGTHTVRTCLPFVTALRRAPGLPSGRR